MATIFDLHAVREEAAKHGLTVETYNEHTPDGMHLRFVGGLSVVDWWPLSKRKTACYFGYRGKTYMNLAKVIAMTKVAMPVLPKKPEPAPVYFEPLERLDITDNRPKVFRYPDGTVHFSDEAEEMLNIVDVDVDVDGWTPKDGFVGGK